MASLGSPEGRAEAEREIMMDAKQASFFRENNLPIIRLAAIPDGTNRSDEQALLRPMLWMLLRYIDYLEARGKEKAEG